MDPGIMTCLPTIERLTYPDPGYLSDDSWHLIILAPCCPTCGQIQRIDARLSLGAEDWAAA
jgi:hypothetical protein